MTKYLLLLLGLVCGCAAAEGESYTQDYDTEPEPVQLGTAEQAVRAPQFTENLWFTVGVDGNSFGFSGFCGAGAGTASWDPTGDHMAQIDFWRQQLSAIMNQVPLGGIGGVACRFPCFGSACPFPGTSNNPLPGNGQYLDLRVMPADLLNCTQGQPVCNLSQNKTASSDFLNGTRARVSSFWLQNQLNKGVTTAQALRYAYCRMFGLAVGLATHSGGASCLGPLPTTKEQLLARSNWTTAEREDIRQIMLIRQSDLQGGNIFSLER
jgi:hypothetical protein